MLTSVLIKNFKKHKDAYFTFERGVNVIVGPNYSGKTSILEAIAYAFVGPKAVAGGSKVIASDDGGQTKVVVNFEADGKDWVLTRTDSTASLVSDSDDAANGKTAVASLLEEVIGQDLRLFNILRYSKQGETSLLLKEGDAKLTKMLEQLTGADLIDKALSVLRDLRLKYEGAIEGMPSSSELREHIVTSSEEVKTKTEEVSALEKRYKELSSEKQRLDELSTHYSELVEKAKKEADVVRRLTRDKDRLSARVASTKQAIDDLRADLLVASSDVETWSDEEAHRLSELSAVLKRLRHSEYELKSITAELEQAETLKENLSSKIKSAKKEKYEAEKKLSTLTAADSYEELQKKMDSLKADLSSVTESIESGVCPECKRPYDDADSVDQLEETKRDLEQQIKGMSPILSKALDEALHKNRITEDVAKLDRKIEAKEASLKSVEATIAEKEIRRYELEKEVEHSPVADLEAEEASLLSFKAKAEAAEATVSRLKRKVQSMESELSSLQNDLSNVEEALANRPDTASIDLTEIEKKQKELSGKWREVVTEMSEITSSKGIAEANIEALSDSISSSEAILKQVEEAETELDRCSRLTKFLRSNRTVVMEGTWRTILAQASSVTSLITGGEIEQVTRTKELGVCYVENGVTRPAQAASGCQEAVMGVAIRAAISRMFSSSMGFIMLDEITADMDEHHAAVTMAVVRDLADQVVSITHRSADISDDYNIIELS